MNVRAWTGCDSQGLGTTGNMFHRDVEPGNVCVALTRHQVPKSVLLSIVICAALSDTLHV